MAQPSSGAELRMSAVDSASRGSEASWLRPPSFPTRSSLLSLTKTKMQLEQMQGREPRAEEAARPRPAVAPASSSSPVFPRSLAQTTLTASSSSLLLPAARCPYAAPSLSSIRSPKAQSDSNSVSSQSSATPSSPSTAAAASPSPPSPSPSSHPQLRELVRLNPSLSDAQLTAVAYEVLNPPPSPSAPFPPLALIACPGSGKTLTLATRIAFFLSHHRIPPSSLLCVTFTRKAKVELQQRVAHLLQRSTGDASAVDSLTVMTFHAFALCTLSRHHSQLGFSRRVEVLKPSRIRVLVKELLIACHSDGSAELHVRHGVHSARTRKRTAAAVEESEESIAALKLEEGRLDDVRDEEIDELLEMVEEEERRRGLHSSQLSSTQPSSHTLDPINSPTPSPSPASSRTSVPSSPSWSSTPLDESALRQLSIQLTKRLISQRQREGLQLRQLHGRPCLCTRMDEKADDESEGERVYSDIVRRYDERLRDEGELSMDDFLPALLALFRSHPDALRQLQEQFRYFFVDEGQDSSRTDLCLLLALIGYPQWQKVEQRSREEGRAFVPTGKMGKQPVALPLLRHLCIVGDPQQSIYGFRGADSRAFELLHGLLDAYGLHALALSTNYRSTRSIVQVASHVIACCPARKPKRGRALRSPEPSRSLPIPRPIAPPALQRLHTTPALPTADSHSAVVHALPSAMMVSAKEVGHRVVLVVSAGPRSECAAIIRHIRRLTQEGPADSRLAYDEIAVLARTRVIVHRLRRACKAAEPAIPVQGQTKPQKRKKSTGRRHSTEDDGSVGSDDGDAGGISGVQPMGHPRAAVSQWLSSSSWQTALAYARLVVAHHNYRVHLDGLSTQLGDAAFTMEPSAVASFMRCLLAQSSNPATAAAIMEGLEHVVQLSEELRERADAAKRRRREGGGVSTRAPHPPQHCPYQVACFGLMEVHEDADDDAVERWARLSRELRQTVGDVSILRQLLVRVQRLYSDCVDSVLHAAADDGRLQRITAPIVDVVAGDIDLSPSLTSSTSPSSSSSSHSDGADVELQALQALQLVIRSQPREPPPPCPHLSAMSASTCVHCPRWSSCLSSLQSFLHLLDHDQIDPLQPYQLQRDGVRSSRALPSQRAEASSHTAEAVRGVFVSTIHQAKGLEWRAVLVASCNEGTLPLHDNGVLDYRDAMKASRREEIQQEREALGLLRDGDEADCAEGHEEEEEADNLLLDPLREECRLAYVAVTRARESLFVSWTLHDDDGFPLQPSRFFTHLAAELVERDTSAGPTGRGQVGGGWGRPPLADVGQVNGGFTVSMKEENKAGGVMKMESKGARWKRGVPGMGTDGASGVFRRASECLQARPLSSHRSLHR